MKLYYNPLSSYSQKVLMACYEKEVSFTPELVDLTDAAAREKYLAINAHGKIPTLVLEDGNILPESSIIIEYLDTQFDSGTRLIAAGKDNARKIRFFDRSADLYLNDPMQKIFFDGRKPEAERDAKGVAAAKATLDTAYGLWDKLLANKKFALGDTFSMADCASAPALNYLKMVYPFENYQNLMAYTGRICERPSFLKVWKEAQPMLAKMS